MKKLITLKSLSTLFLQEKTTFTQDLRVKLHWSISIKMQMIGDYQMSVIDLVYQFQQFSMNNPQFLDAHILQMPNVLIVQRDGIFWYQVISVYQFVEIMQYMEQKNMMTETQFLLMVISIANSSVPTIVNYANLDNAFNVNLVIRFNPSFVILFVEMNQLFIVKNMMMAILKNLMVFYKSIIFAKQNVNFVLINYAFDVKMDGNQLVINVNKFIMTIFWQYYQQNNVILMMIFIVMIVCNYGKKIAYIALHIINVNFADIHLNWSMKYINYTRDPVDILFLELNQRNPLLLMNQINIFWIIGKQSTQQIFFFFVISKAIIKMLPRSSKIFNLNLKQQYDLEIEKETRY
ncbi:unnamed protein product [Paramecium octaurelia]|uniref:Transmembrane protein n=1 Tax=Paramecium octaurelia TaxID=43137 RepID=A0A8S1WRU3_PAROT|nr:unnamed protein product [Paramecium octaurelia]